jgi:hypothetical protein
MKASFRSELLLRPSRALTEAAQSLAKASLHFTLIS